jgi:hypothetical protein
VKKTRIADYLLAAALATSVLVMQSCTDDDPGMPVGAACQHRAHSMVKCGRNQFRPA